MKDIFCQEIDQVLMTTKEIYNSITHVRKKYHLYTFLNIKEVTKEFPYSTRKNTFC